jgi:membrane-associated phospholipid phosphatase
MAVVVVYFAYLGCVALVRRGVPVKRRILVAAVAVTMIAAAVNLRDLYVVPLVFLLVGYWLPAMLVVGPNKQLEEALLAFDYRLFGTDGLARFRENAPRSLVTYLELSYLLCYAVVPAGLVWLTASGHQNTAGSFWTTVLLASFGCYGLLPWLPSRAPRAVECHETKSPSMIRSVNVLVLDCASVGWNTFPSGHTAASLAVALAVARDVPAAGVILGVLALSIAIGSVVGRYHYAGDAIAGAAVAAVAFTTSTAARGL